ALVATWRAQAESIRAHFGTAVDEPVPQRLKLDQVLKHEQANGRSLMAMAAAAAIVAFMVGGAAGWMARGASAAAPSSFDIYATEALDAHKLYVVEVRHPVAVPGGERAHMTQWLSKRLDKDLRIPDLQSIGLKLVGGRLLPGPSGDATAFYMYEGPSGERFTIFCTPSQAPLAAMRFKAMGRFAAFYWVDRSFAYVVAGPAERERLNQVAQTAYDQLDKVPIKHAMR